MTDTIKILILEGNDADLELILDRLNQEKVKYDYIQVSNEPDFLKVIEEFKPDIILSDLLLPNFDGERELSLASKLRPRTPLIIITNSKNEEAAGECMKAGAVDYIIKGNLIRLVPAIRNAIKYYRAENESEKNEKLLKDALAKLNFYFDNNPLGAVEFNNKFQVIKWSKTAEAIFGWTEEEIIGKSFDEIRWVHEEDIERVANMRSNMTRGTITSGVSVNKNYRKDGSVIICEWYNSVLWGEDGKLILFQSLVFDITRRTESEERIRNSEKQYRNLFDHDLTGNFIISPEGKILMCNQALVNIIGYSTIEQMIGMNIFDFYSDEKEREEFINKIKSKEQIKLYEYRLTGYSGKEIYVVENAFGKFNENGELVQITGYLFDDTESKRTEKELIKAKEKAESASKLKDAFIANISHEIRTPLNGILGLANLIKEVYAHNIKKEDEELFQGIDFSSKRIIRTVDMMLNYSRIQVGEFPLFQKKINLTKTCIEIVKEYATAAKFKSLELTFQSSLIDVEISADEYSIVMAISNLIDNAIKYTERGSIKVILRKGNNDIILDIKDTGIGVSEEYLTRIFEPYSQEHIGYGRAYEGIGLGLSLVQKVLDLNRANVSVKSKKGEGSTFSINFGKTEQLFEHDGITGLILNNNDLSEKSKIKTVLIVEDDYINQMTIKRFLGKNYETLISDSSERTMEILTKEKVDIILMDISIRGYKNGLELTKELKASKDYSQIPIIAITAHAFEIDKQNALQAGCDVFLAKPFTKESLLEILDSIVGRGKR